MTITPTIYQVSPTFSQEDFLALPRQQFTSDWFGSPLEFKAEFCLATNSTHLLFLVSAENTPRFTNHSAGKFVENLWEQDVGELFIKHGSESDYQEWNLSPSGAWWTQKFEGARAPDPQFAPDTTTLAQVEPCETGWLSWMQIPYQEQVTPATAIDITMILTDAQGQRRFLSCCPDPDIAPNFHRPKSYQTPKVIHFS